MLFHDMCDIIENMKKTEQYCVDKIKEFYERNGQWPRSQEISSISRMIQRKFGGLPAFRKKYNLGYENYATGDYRSEVAKAANFKGHESENEVFDFLVNKYGRANVHREYLVYSNARNRADFCIFDNNKEILLIDVFYPKDKYSFQGCLASKANKYKDFNRCKVVFIQLNSAISQDDIDYIVSRKKKSLELNHSIVSFETFKHTQQSVV